MYPNTHLHAYARNFVVSCQEHLVSTQMEQCMRVEKSAGQGQERERTWRSAARG